MSNLIQRIIMFCFFIPLIVVLILFMPWANHLALQCLLIIVNAGLGLEIGRIFGLWPWQPRNEAPALPSANPAIIHHGQYHLARFWRTIAILACGLSPLAGRMLAGFSILPGWIIPLSFVLPVVWIFTSQVLKSQKVAFEWFSRTVSGYLIVLLYPALGMSYFFALMYLPDASFLLLVYLGGVFLNDTFAYVAGRLFGKFSSRPLRISPNKTTVGFIFGFLASPLVMMLGWFFRPGLFPGGPWVALALGVATGFLTIIGDLFESGIKRSFGFKDSGTVILGRGGLLDSLDSLIFTAPIFYYAYTLLNQLPIL